MKIGFVGLGIMGESMSENIVKKHDDKVYVFDFVKEKVDKLAAIGAVPCESSREVAENVDVFISMVPKSEHSRAVYDEIIPVLKEGKTCIDMSTIDPSVSVEIANKVKATGAEFIDAPVVKSKPAAIAGKLGIYVGGSEEVYEKMRPILLYMGENVIRMGDNGKGLVMKICHNALVSQIQNGVNETMTLAKKNGIDIPLYAQAISYGGAGNWYLDSKKEVLEKEDFTTAFSIENEHKDVHICLNLAKECGFSMPGEENAARVYDKAMEMGIGKEDFSATIKVVRGE
ncbi:NAD(P)-dependent oxidoreductase [Butyrivibrio sp. FCS014]|uniref:NAD(P)-dependent oxidoreductase n=1 Tax=Butyrivibrio sp. FCS014 TaxID=1408304 RepID=UPI00046655E5|nr:NAD(P)-dependent oxidoreductase [Butyrivibrio sp. FCS014]